MSTTTAFLEEDLGSTIVASSVSLAAVSTAFVIARLYTRACIRRRLFVDDLLIVFAAILHWAEVLIIVFEVSHGGGKHWAVLSAEQRGQMKLLFTVATWPGILALGVPKLAVAALLGRLLMPSRRMTVLAWSVAVLCMINFLVVALVLTFQCVPIRAKYDMTITGAQCIEDWVTVDLCFYASAFSAFANLFFAVWPAVVFWGMHMSLSKTIALSASLGLGTVACVIALYKTSRLRDLSSDDFSYDISPLIITTMAEDSAIAGAACIPMLKPLYVSIRRRLSYAPNPSDGPDAGLRMVGTEEGGWWRLGKRKRRVGQSYVRVASLFTDAPVDMPAKEGVSRQSGDEADVESGMSSSETEDWPRSLREGRPL